MDSLLANYASSDEDEEQQQQPQPKRTVLAPPKRSEEPSLSKASSFSLFSSLPKPKSSPPPPLFQALPQPNQAPANPSLSQPKPFLEEDPKRATKPSGTVPKPSSFFSSLPQPKSQLPQKPISNVSSSEPNPKRVVQFKPPINPYSVKPSEIDDEDDDEEYQEKERRRRRDSESSSQTSSVKSFLSSIPVPKNSVTLGALPSSGSGRRAIVETEVSASNSGGPRAEQDSSTDTNVGNHENHDNSANYESGIDPNAGNYANYYSYGNFESGTDQNAVNYGYYENYISGIDQTAGVSQTGSSISGGDGSIYGNYDGYGSNGDYGQYGNPWVEGSATAVSVPENSGASQSGFKVSGKRGRNEVPKEIVEVKQDELIKNRPREDQVKLTGIAFGPSYQPTSTKGKPTKLHKRKHQIGSLYYDMRQKEMELAERRAKGFLTKAETQAKYGW